MKKAKDQPTLREAMRCPHCRGKKFAIEIEADIEGCLEADLSYDSGKMQTTRIDAGNDVHDPFEFNISCSNRNCKSLSSSWSSPMDFFDEVCLKHPEWDARKLAQQLEERVRETGGHMMKVR